MSAYRQTKKGINGWEQRVQVRGQRVRLWARTKDELQALILDLEDRSQRGRRGFRSPKGILTYDELCERVLAVYPHRERSREALSLNLAYSRRWFGPQTLFEFDAEDIEEWLISLRIADEGRRALAPYTRRNALKAMRQALNWAVAKGYLDVNYAAHVDPPAVSDHPDPLGSWEQVFAIARRFEWPSYGRAVRFAAGMGLRPQEWVVLRERDVDRKTGTLTISRTWSGREVELAKTESSRATVYLSDIAREVLDELPRNLDPDALLFPTPAGQVINVGNWRRREWRDALAAAKVRYRGPKHLRHTFATLALKAGVPLEDVSRMLRHDSVRTTERYYLRVVPHVKRRSAERLSAEMPRFEALGEESAGS